MVPNCFYNFHVCFFAFSSQLWQLLDSSLLGLHSQSSASGRLSILLPRFQQVKKSWFSNSFIFHPLNFQLTELSRLCSASQPRLSTHSSTFSWAVVLETIFSLSSLGRARHPTHRTSWAHRTPKTVGAQMTKVKSLSYSWSSL